MQRAHLNLLLALIVAGLAAALYFGGGEEEAPKPPLTALIPTDVQRITLRHPGRDEIRLARVDGRWQLQAPVAADADTFNVDAILALASTPVEASVDNPPSLAELGLEPPRYTVLLDDTAIDFGGSEPLKYRRYVRSGGQVKLIQDPAALALDADYEDLVSRRLLPDGVQLSAIALPGLGLTRGADGAWSVTGQPDADPAAVKAQVDALIDAWRTADAMWNAKPDPDPVAASTEDLVLTAADGRSWRFRLIAREPQLQLVNLDTGIRHHLSASLAGSLLGLKTPEAPQPSPVDEGPAPAVEPHAESH